MSNVFLFVGAVLVLTGAATTWLAMNSPIQLQPITWISLGLGFLLMLFGLGGMLLA